jgi:hypothetical protein
MGSQDAMTAMDSEMLSFIMDDIDFDNAGLSFETVEMVYAEAPNFSFGDNTDVKKELKTITDSGKDIKEVRNGMKGDIKDQWSDKPYIILTFDNMENKAWWCDEHKLDAADKYFRAETLFKQLFDQ